MASSLFWGLRFRRQGKPMLSVSQLTNGYDLCYLLNPIPGCPHNRHSIRIYGNSHYLKKYHFSSHIGFSWSLMVLFSIREDTGRICKVDFLIKTGNKIRKQLQIKHVADWKVANVLKKKRVQAALSNLIKVISVIYLNKNKYVQNII